MNAARLGPCRYCMTPDEAPVALSEAGHGEACAERREGTCRDERCGADSVDLDDDGYGAACVASFGVHQAGCRCEDCDDVDILIDMQRDERMVAE